jgi:hypothetical protein
MSETAYPDVYVRVVAITRGESILTIFNEKWGGFTLPMSQMRKRPDARNPQELVEEDPETTAIRVMVEALGRPLASDERPRRHAVHTLDPFIQSGRDGIWKCYHYEVFQFELSPDEVPKPYGGVPMAWMTPEEMKTLKPVTTSAIYIVTAMKAASSPPNAV